MKTAKRKSGGKVDKHETNLEQEMNEDFMSEKSIKVRPEKLRKHQGGEEYVDPQLSSRILKEARLQQLEIQNERDMESGVAAARNAFSDAAKATLLHSRPTLATSVAGSDNEVDDDGEEQYSDTESQYEEMAMEEVTEEDEQAIAVFMARDSAPGKTLADLILAKIRVKEDEAGISQPEDRTIPGLDSKVTEVYRGVGQLLHRYSAGKLPKAFKIIPSLSNWEDILYLTDPESWSSPAMYAATRLFASNLNAHMAQRFYHLVLLPRVRQDIKVNKRLHFALYQSLKKALYKPSAFYKGFLLPLCQSRTCNLREAFIVGSVLQKVSIPVLHTSVAMMKIAQMQYSGTNSYFLKILLDKKYALPYRVIDALLAHFVSFMEEEREVPVIWHQCLLTFVQRYKNELKEEDHDNLRKLMKKHRHYLMTPEIQRELQHSLTRGNKVGSTSGTQSSVVVKTAVEEDFRNLPEVIIEMEED